MLADIDAVLTLMLAGIDAGRYSCWQVLMLAGVDVGRC